MGEVYEGEHLESGRRIALKLLRERLESADQRARFLREGQLAAAVSHPHTVYIFGSEEISGMPVITMELLPGGTLKDRVVSQGPLPPNEAVSAILDIVGGLDAAQAAGILHRDIKPSNCFVDRAGAVKVGDFGLSISTLARDVRNEMTNSGFEGTPQFAPPEQLRGEPLDVRADIYAVGATLYYLLTGQAPFDARNLRELVTRVTTEPAKSPRTLRPDIPPGLASVVLQCLEKTPAQRPASYAALAEALRPFSLLDDMPARPGPRIVAGLVDGVVMSTVSSMWLVSTTNVLMENPTAGIWTSFVSPAYYFLLEGIWGRSPGKWMLGLRVASLDGTRAGWRKILCRVTVFSLPSLLMMALAVTGVLTPENSPQGLRTAISMTLLLAIYVTARKGNGWAGLHDLQSGTRVVTSVPLAFRRAAKPAVAPSLAEVVTAPKSRRYGPFIVTPDAIEPASSGRLIAGFDPILRRQVWIRSVSAGTPPIDSARRDLGRPERLYWLTGKRSSTENWDAFEAPDGVCLLKHAAESVDWPLLKLWLTDLVHELRAATKDGSLPELALDRVWIRSDQRLVLLDFPAPGSDTSPHPKARERLSPIELLSAVARFGLSRNVPATTHLPLLPLTTRRLLDRLTSNHPPSLDEAQRLLADALRTPDKVQRWRRTVPIALSAAPSFVLILLVILLLPLLAGFLGQNAEMIGALELLRVNPPTGSRFADPEFRQTFEIYVAGRYGADLVSDEFWKGPVMQRLSDRRKFAEEIVARHPSVTPEELARVRQIVEPEIQRIQRTRNRDRGNIAGMGAIMAQALTWMTLLGAVALSLASAAIVPGGIMTRFMGLAVVTRDGTEISRLRSVARTLIAWSPVLVWLAFLAAAPRIQGWVPNPSSPLSIAIPTLGVLVIGAVWAVAQPARGLHDRVAGAWIVPR
jgi:uncharacterized RDD family membrane protein YckC